MKEKKFSYKTKYQKENLKRVYVDVKKEFGEKFDKLLAENNLKRTDVLLPVMQEFIENPKKFKKD